jgi:hypothetical protein
MLDTAVGAWRLPTAGYILGGAALMTAVLLVPRAGLGLALALMAASAWGYGSQVRAGVVGPAWDAERPVLPRRLLLARAGLSVAALVALVAPLLVRNRGYALPPAEDSASVGLGALMVLALAGWVLAPLMLLAAFAEDGDGPLPAARTLAAVGRHPLATLAALLVVPLGLLATEALVAALAWQQGQLPLLVADLFPPPRVAQLDDGAHFYFDYGGTPIDLNCSDSFNPMLGVYPHGVCRGFTLSALVPASLSVGLFQVRQRLWMYHVNPVHYLILRIALTLLILWAAGTLLTVQARWLGAIASVDSASARRPEHPTPGETGETASSLTG